MPVRSIAFSSPEYDNSGTLTGIRYFKHAGYGTGKLITAEQIASMWQDRQQSTGVTLVEWSYDKDTEQFPEPVRTRLGGC